MVRVRTLTRTVECLVARTKKLEARVAALEKTKPATYSEHLRALQAHTRTNMGNLRNDVAEGGNYVLRSWDE